MPNVTMLQWGRNFFVTEIGLRFSSLHAVLLLQWGRNFFVTEISAMLLLDKKDQRGRFNGAVTFSLRKYERESQKIAKYLWLQWGRNFFVTEISNRNF